MLEAGAIEGEDMLPEVALVKLMWLLANRSDEVHSLVGKPLAGEISFSTPITA
jgi:glutamyl-tRNA(Gln) amidotransferase subunit D